MAFRLFLLLISMTALGLSQSPNVAGDYAGTLGPLHLKLHLKVDTNGHISGTLDSVDQGATGLPCENIRLNGNKLSFEVPSVHGNWSGSVSDDGSKLTGDWSQGNPMALTFQREAAFVPAPKPSAVDGVWLGTLDAGAAKLRIQLHVKGDAGGKEYCTLDSLDQGATGLECDNVRLSGKDFSFDVPSVNGRWAGKLNESGNKLDGTWSQGGQGLTLKLARQSAPVAAEKPLPPKYDDARAPVPVSDMKAALDADLAGALKNGALGPGTGGRVVVGVVQHGKREILAYGTAKPDALFEIGSITKTFTGLILAQLVEQGKVKFDEPVRQLLPDGTVQKPEGAEITLLDLATQHSGLPRMPDNFHPANPQDPYADYGAKNLYEFIGKHGITKPANPGFLYSNLGFGVLGVALCNAANTSYAELLKEEITVPLGLKDTVVTLSPEQQARFEQGHNFQHQPAHAWMLDAMAGAGAIRSTTADMLTYLEAQLHPERVKISNAAPGSAAATLSDALAVSHHLHADALPGMQIALAWLHNTQTGTYWHNGGTGGFSSYVFFNPDEDCAAVVLFNTSVGPRGSFADLLGEHIAARFAGKPAIALSAE